MWTFRRLFPHVAVQRTWGPDGRPVWEFRYSSRDPHGAVSIASDARPDLDDGPIPVDRLLRALGPTPERSGPASVVSSLGVQIDGDGLRIDEYRYRITKPTIDVGDPLHQPDIAMALADLAADPGDEALCRRVLTRLAVAHGWFLNAPNLEVSSALITGRGVGQVLDGVFVWRAQGPDDTFTYIVTPDLPAKDLLKAEPALTRSLIRVACPRPDDAHGELGDRLRDALVRLGAVIGPAAARHPDSPAVTAVLEIKDAAPDVGGRLDEAVEERAPDPAGRALSEELAKLARKVGTRAPRPAPAEGGA